MYINIITVVDYGVDCYILKSRGWVKGGRQQPGDEAICQYEYVDVEEQ